MSAKSPLAEYVLGTHRDREPADLPEADGGDWDRRKFSSSQYVALELCRTVLWPPLHRRAHYCEIRHSPGCGIAAQVVRGNLLQAGPLATASDDVPDHVLRDATAPHFSLTCDRSEGFALRDIRGLCPVVESG